MAETKHTPGPWFPCKIGSYDYSVRTEKRPELILIPVRITEVNESIYNELKEEALANAKLIASAPELLDALQYAVRFIRMCPLIKEEDQPRGLEKWESVIKKATE